MNAKKKTFSLEIYWQKYFIGDRGIYNKYFPTLDEMSTSLLIP